MGCDQRFTTYYQVTLVALVFIAALFGLFSHVDAQTVDGLLDEGVQILTEKHEIMQLKNTGQLNNAQAQEKLQANRQRWNDYSKKIHQLPPDKQRGFMEQLKNRNALALARQRQKGNTDARQSQKDENIKVAEEPASPGATLAQEKTESNVSSSDHRSKSLDVMGIAIGMNTSEVKTVLSNKFPSKSNFPINFDSYGKQWVGQYISLPAAMIQKNNSFNKKADEAVIIDFSNPPFKQEVLAVTKYQSYPNDKTPSLEATETSLINKYGQWDKKEEKGGTNYYFWGNHEHNSPPCISIQLLDPNYRLKDLVRGDTTQAVICQGYGVWAQCIKPVRSLISLDSSLKGCGVQAAAYIHFISKGTSDISPVTEIATFVGDFTRLYDSELAFAELARNYEKDKNRQSIKSGGTPKL